MKKFLQQRLGLCFWLTIFALVPASKSSMGARYDWLEFNGDALHSGNNRQENIIDTSNVANLELLFQMTLPEIVDGAPVYLSAVITSAGTKDLLFVTTKAGHILALDARTGAPLWMQQNPPGDCRVNNELGPCFTTSSPAIDPNRQYVYSYGLDGYVHKYRVEDGTEITSGGWPELTTLKGFDEKASSALSVATARDGVSYLYVTHAAYPRDPGDLGDYQGHVTTINLMDGTQHVFNAACSNQVDVHFVAQPATPDCAQRQMGIWSRAGVVYDPATDKIYVATGNGTFDPGNHQWGDTVFALRADGTGDNGDPLDSYTPSNYQQLDEEDDDLGSSNPVILTVPATYPIQHLALQGGKQSEVRLINLDNLSGAGGAGNTGGELGTTIDLPQGGKMMTTPVAWVNPSDGRTWVILATTEAICAMQLAFDGYQMPSLTMEWQRSEGGTSPLVANGVLYYANNNGVWALDPISGAALWNSNQIGPIHWQSPVVANGVLYITDEAKHLSAFALRNQVGPFDLFLPFILR